MKEILLLAAVVLVAAAPSSVSAESRVSEHAGASATSAGVSTSASARLNFRIEIASRLGLKSNRNTEFVVGGSTQHVLTSCQDLAGQQISCAAGISHGGAMTLADP